MKTLTYTNRQLNETYTISGDKLDLAKGWGSMMKLACRRMNWNFEMCANDVQVRLTSAK